VGLKNISDQLQFLGFVDYGIASDRYLAPGEAEKTELLGMGPGLRYTITQHFSIRSDYGFPILGGTGSQWHIGTVLSF
jgi:hemolysin activation/secretion protein